MAFLFQPLAAVILKTHPMDGVCSLFCTAVGRRSCHLSSFSSPCAPGFSVRPSHGSLCHPGPPPISMLQLVQNWCPAHLFGVASVSLAAASLSIQPSSVTFSLSSSFNLAVSQASGPDK